MESQQKLIDEQDIVENEGNQNNLSFVSYYRFLVILQYDSKIPDAELNF